MKKTIFSSVVVLILIVVSGRDIFFSSGEIVPNWDRTVVLDLDAAKNRFSQNDFAWSSFEEAGYPTHNNSVNIIYDKLALAFYYILPTTVANKALPFVFIFLSFIFMYRFLQNLGLDFRAVLLASVFFGFNPRTFSIIISGHYEHLLSYAFLPAILNAMFVIVKSKEAIARLTATLVLPILLSLACSSNFGLIILPISVLFFAVYCLIEKKGFWNLLAALVVFSFINLYWIAPNVESMLGNNQTRYGGDSSKIISQYDGYLNGTAATPFESILGIRTHESSGIGSEFIFTENITHRALWYVSAIFIFITMAFGVVLNKSSIKIMCSIALLAYFVLAMGNNTPLGQFIYANLRKIVPYYCLVARTSRWLFMYYFFGMCLFAFGMTCILKKAQNKRVDFPVFLIFLACGSIYISPWYEGLLTKSERNSPQSFSLELSSYSKAAICDELNIKRYLSTDKSVSRILVAPQLASLATNGRNYPQSPIANDSNWLGYDNLIRVDHGSNFSHFIMDITYNKDYSIDVLPAVAGIASTKYFIVNTKDEFFFYRDFGWMQMDKHTHDTLYTHGQPDFPLIPADNVFDLSKTIDLSYLKIFKNELSIDRISPARGLLLLTGGYRTLYDLSMYYPEIVRSWGIVFSDDIPDGDMGKFSFSGIITTPESFYDVVLPFLAWQNKYTPSNHNKYWQETNNLWDKNISFINTKINEKSIVSTRPALYEHQIHQNGEATILAKIFLSKDCCGGNVYLNDLLIKEIKPYSVPKDEWFWIEIKSKYVADGDKMTFEALGPGFGICAFVVVDSSEISKILNDVNKNIVSKQNAIIIEKKLINNDADSWTPVSFFNLPKNDSRVELKGLYAQHKEELNSNFLSPISQKGTVFLELSGGNKINGFLIKLLCKPLGKNFNLRGRFSTNGIDFLDFISINEDNHSGDFNLSKSINLDSPADKIFVELDLERVGIQEYGSEYNDFSTIHVYANNSFALNHNAPISMLENFDLSNYAKVTKFSEASQVQNIFHLGNLFNISIDSGHGVIKKVSPSNYEYTSETPSNTFFFSENFHPGWHLITEDNKQISPLECFGSFQCYQLQEPISRFFLVFRQQKNKTISAYISIVSFMAIYGWLLIVLIVNRKSTLKLLAKFTSKST